MTDALDFASHTSVIEEARDVPFDQSSYLLKPMYIYREEKYYVSQILRLVIDEGIWGRFCFFWRFASYV